MAKIQMDIDLQNAIYEAQNMAADMAALLVPLLDYAYEMSEVIEQRTKGELSPTAFCNLADRDIPTLAVLASTISSQLKEMQTTLNSMS